MNIKNGQEILNEELNKVIGGIGDNSDYMIYAQAAAALKNGQVCTICNTFKSTNIDDILNHLSSVHNASEQTIKQLRISMS